VADVLVLTRRDGSTEVAHIGSPFLAVVFEDVHHRTPDGPADNGWMAYYDINGEAPPNHQALLDWLRQFIATDVAEFSPDPTAVATNGAVEQDSSSLT
jgi:hypothetical protein